jgi:hypothetical protein
MTVHSHPVRHDQAEPTKGSLHPLVYRIIIGLTFWFIVSIWVLFDRGSYVGLTFAMITVFFVIVTGIPVLIWQTWRHNAPRNDSRPVTESFRSWTNHEFPTWTGTLSGTEAAMQILLPIAAVCIGITIFGLVFLFAVPHAAY